MNSNPSSLRKGRPKSLPLTLATNRGLSSGLERCKEKAKAKVNSWHVSKKKEKRRRS